MPSIWNDSGFTTIKQQPIPSISYQQDLDAGLPTSQLHKSQVRYWSDFNRVFFHPRSIVQLNEYSLNSSIAPFENWGAGEELFRDVDREADLLDRDVRAFVEECDSIQGLQVFSGVDDAWGGWTSRYIDALRDEYGKKSIWVYGIEDNKTSQREKILVKKANAARTFSDVSKLASAYTMLSTRPENLPTYLNSDLNSEWESSALMATAIDSVTLPTRLRSTVETSNRSNMPQYEQFLTSEEGRTIWDLGLKLDQQELPQPVTPATNSGPRQDPNHNSQQIAEDQPDQAEATTLDITFTPDTTYLLPPTARQTTKSSLQHNHTFTQICTTRFPNTTLPIQTQRPLTQETITRLRYADLPILKTYSVPLAFPLLDAYPASLFSTSSSTLQQQERPGLSLTAGLITSSHMKRTIFDLRDLVTRYSRVIAVDEREDLHNEMTEVGERYTFGWESEGDDDWDSGEE